MMNFLVFISGLLVSAVFGLCAGVPISLAHEAAGIVVGLLVFGVSFKAWFSE